MRKGLADMSEVALTIYNRLSGFTWFVTTGLREKDFDVGHDVVIYAVPGMKVMPTIEHWRMEFSQYHLILADADAALRPEEGIEHPDKWPRELAVQKIDVPGRTWRDYKVITGTAAEIQEQATAIVKDETQWPLGELWMYRMVRVVRPEYQRSRSPLGEPEGVYYTRTKCEVLLQFVADKPPKTVSVQLD